MHIDEPTLAFPHAEDANDCRGNLILEGDAQWVGDSYVHRWHCPDCQVTALEAFTLEGFVEAWEDDNL